MFGIIQVLYFMKWPTVYVLDKQLLDVVSEIVCCDHSIVRKLQLILFAWKQRCDTIFSFGLEWKHSSYQEKHEEVR